MDAPLVIRGRLTHKAFVADEPMPDVEGPADLIVYASSAAADSARRHSMSSVFGTASQLRTAEDIDAQIAEERRSWDEE
jgi:hypothetical protein